MIDDGTPEREVGECFRWCIMFCPTNQNLTISTARLRSAREGTDYSYQVVAEIVHVSEGSSLIDFGLRAVGHTDWLPTGCKQGDYVTGDVLLSFPLCFDPLPEDVIASMDYDWVIKHIMADLTPYRPFEENSRLFVRDDQRVAYEEVKSTRDRTADSYILQCVLRD